MNLGYTFKRGRLILCLSVFQTHPVQQVSVDGMFFCSSVKLKVRQWLYRRAHSAAAAQPLAETIAEKRAGSSTARSTARKQERL